MMKKVLLLSIGLWSFFSVLSQTAKINEQDCPNAFSCFNSFCSGQTFELRASLSSGNIESVKWFERIMDGNTNQPYDSWSEVGNGQYTINAPFKSLPSGNYYYRYWLVVYYEGGGGIPKTAYMNLNKVDPPNAQISGNNEICEGEAVTFFASGGSNYVFKVNEIIVPSTGNQCTISSLGNDDIVKVEVTENGCSATDQITMTVHPLPDVGLIKPSSSSCNDMLNWNYNNLTGTGPWVVSFWDPTHAIQYDADYTVTAESGTINGVQIPHGTPFVHIKISNQHCSNF